MGSVELELGEIMNLQLGDIIQLDTKVDQPIVMQIANQKLFKVFIGKSRYSGGCSSGFLYARMKTQEIDQ